MGKIDCGEVLNQNKSCVVYWTLWIPGKVQPHVGNVTEQSVCNLV